jgi:hypothetical protein
MRDDCPADMRRIIRGDHIFLVPRLPPEPCAYVGPARLTPWEFNDGGGSSGNNACVERALPIATRIPRARIERELELAHLYEIGFRNTPTVEGWPHRVTDRVLRARGWRYTQLRTNAEPCSTHLADLPSTELLIVELEGRDRASYKGHVTVLEHGVVRDKFNPSDHAFGQRQCALGYWRKETP